MTKSQYRMIATLADLFALVDDHVARGEQIYIRYSDGPDSDRTYGASRNHATGQMEPGLSVNNLIGRHAPFTRGEVARQVREHFAFCGPICYLLTGEEVGRGSDNEPCLDVDTWRPVGLVAPEVVNEAIATPLVEGCAHPAHKLDRYTNATFCRQCGLRVA